MSSPAALWALARPRLLAFILLLPLVGFGWAHWGSALTLRGEGAFAWVLLAWALLQTGTMWLNAALDQDRGEVLMGRAVPVPPVTAKCAYAALALAAGVAFLAGPIAGAACATCAVLAVFYSHPATAWKGHAILGPLVNLVGYGLLSTLAGWSVVEAPFGARAVVVWWLGALGVMGCYFAVQAFQEAEDRARGYATLVATHGPRAALVAARLCIRTGLAGGMVLAALGWLPRVCLAGVPFGVWVDRWLAAWTRQPNGGGERWARGLALRLLACALVGIALAYGDLVYRDWNEQPVAGLGTAGGWPIPPEAAKE